MQRKKKVSLKNRVFEEKAKSKNLVYCKAAKNKNWAFKIEAINNGRLWGTLLHIPEFGVYQVLADERHLPVFHMDDFSRVPMTVKRWLVAEIRRQLEKGGSQ